jgi:hypothetical protein
MQHRNSISPEKFKHLKLNHIYRKLTRAEHFIITLSTEIASAYGIKLQIPNNGEELGIGTLLAANGLGDVDFNKIIMDSFAPKTSSDG